jgi:hypothetical protein
MKKITADVMPLYAVPEEDAKKFIQWVWSARDKVNFDPDTLLYPRSCMTRAQNEEETLMLIPLQPVLMFESMARKPELSDGQSVYCLHKIGQVVESLMEDTGHREAYFLTNDEREAETCSRHGWTKALYDPEKKTWLMKRKTEAAKFQPPVSETPEANTDVA